MSRIERTRYVTWYIGEIRKLLSSSFSEAREAKIKAFINIINALIIPSCYISVCNGEIHVVVLEHGENFNKAKLKIPTVVHWRADVVWSFETLTNRWIVVKDRFGTCERYGRPEFRVW